MRQEPNSSPGQKPQCAAAKTVTLIPCITTACDVRMLLLPTAPSHQIKLLLGHTCPSLMPAPSMRPVLALACVMPVLQDRSTRLTWQNLAKRQACFHSFRNAATVSAGNHLHVSIQGMSKANTCQVTIKPLLNEATARRAYTGFTAAASTRHNTQHQAHHPQDVICTRSLVALSRRVQSQPPTNTTLSDQRRATANRE